MTGTDVVPWDPDGWEQRTARAAQRLAIGDALATVDVRDPRAATQPLHFQSPGYPQTPLWDANTAVREGYLANVIAFRCVQIIANTLAGLPFRAGPDPDRRTDWNRQAPLARLLGPAPGGPAPKLSARKLWAWTVAQRLVTGRHAWEIELDGAGRPVAFWPLVSANLNAIPTTSGTEWFAYFTYGRPDEPRRLNPDQTFYGWDPHPTDFRQPFSALEAAKYDLSIAQAADRYSWSFLRNGAVPAAVVITGAFEDRRERARFRNQWQAKYRGPENAGKVAFAEVEKGHDLAQSFDIRTLGLPQKDAQMIEQHRAVLEHVAIDLGVPWSKLDASDRTYDNAEAEERTFWENTMLPLIATLEDEVNMDLAPRLGSDAGWFDVSEVPYVGRKPVPLTARVGAPSMVQSQIMTINEGRADYGLPPIPDGDRMMTAEEIAALRGSTAAVELLGRDAPEPEIRTPEPEPAPELEPAPVVRETAGPDPDDIEARRLRLWRRTDRAARILEGRWERTMRRLFDRQADATLRRLEGNRGHKIARGDTRDPGGEVFDPRFWEDETAEVTRDLYEQVAAAALNDLGSTFDIDFDLFDPLVVDLVEARANQLAGQVTDTTYRQITEALAAGVQEGESIPKLAERVRAVFDEASTNRATVIARTEVISAYNGAATAQAAALPADVVGGSEWIATRDGRTRPAHAAADGQLQPIGEPFNVGGEELGYPGDPAGRAANTVQCRCAVAFLTPEEFAEESQRSPVVVDLRRAAGLLRLVKPGDEIDARVWRAVLEDRHAA